MAPMIEPDSPPPAGGGAREVVRTYLELPGAGALRPAPFPAEPPVRVVPRPACGVAEYRALYATVGAAWRWHDRDAWSDDRLAAWLARPEVEVWVLEHRPGGAAGGWEPGGYYELAREGSDVELVYFGLVGALHGRGLGAALLTHATERAWALGAGRVWLHTCTLDGPAALPNYLRRGFRPYREERYTVAG